MTTVSFLFYVFAAILLFAGFKVVTSRNPVHAALYLVLAFSQASGLWILMQAEFLAITLIVVYVGAVMVLFLFVVMMLDIGSQQVRDGFWKYFPLAAVLGLVIALEIGLVVMSGFGAVTQAPAMQTVGGNVMTSNTKELGVMLYTHYLFPLEIAAALLLVGMIAAIALTLRERKDTRTASASTQVRVKATDRLEIVKAAPTKMAPPPAPSDPESTDPIVAPKTEGISTSPAAPKSNEGEKKT